MTPLDEVMLLSGRNIAALIGHMREMHRQGWNIPLIAEMALEGEAQHPSTNDEDRAHLRALYEDRLSAAARGGMPSSTADRSRLRRIDVPSIGDPVTFIPTPYNPDDRTATIGDVKRLIEQAAAKTDRHASVDRDAFYARMR